MCFLRDWVDEKGFDLKKLVDFIIQNKYFQILYINQKLIINRQS